MQFVEKFLNLRMLLIIFLCLPVSCVDKTSDPNDPEQSFVRAREPYDNEMYEIAIQRLGEYKSRFPYSKNAADAELMIADSHFKLAQFAESAAAYEQFVKLHPRHAKADFAQFRVGEAYWSDAPEAIDREQDYTLKAVTEWEKMLKEYPNSEHKAEAAEKMNAGRRRIADHAQFVARFYCKKEIYHACAYRYLQVAEQYPEFKDIQKNAFVAASTAFAEMAKEKSKDEQSDKNMYFKSMSAAQLQQKSEEMARIAANIAP